MQQCADQKVYKYTNIQDTMEMSTCKVELETLVKIKGLQNELLAKNIKIIQPELVDDAIDFVLERKKAFLNQFFTKRGKTRDWVEDFLKHTVRGPKTDAVKEHDLVM